MRNMLCIVANVTLGTMHLREKNYRKILVFPVLLDDFKGLIPHSCIYFIVKAILCIILKRTYRNTLKDLSSLEP